MSKGCIALLNNSSKCFNLLFVSVRMPRPTLTSCRLSWKIFWRKSRLVKPHAWRYKFSNLRVFYSSLSSTSFTTSSSSIWLAVTALVFSYFSKLFFVGALHSSRNLCIVTTTAIQLRYHSDGQGWSYRINHHTELELLFCFVFVLFAFFSRITLVLGLSKDPWKSLRHRITTITSSTQWVCLKDNIKIHFLAAVHAYSSFSHTPLKVLTRISPHYAGGIWKRRTHYENASNVFLPH